MRYLYFACISLSLSLFFCNHAHARLGETYEESVKRYEKAGFTKERTTVQVPPDDPELGFFEIDKKPVKRFDKGMKEITWTKTNPRGGKPVEVISIRQLFYYEWPPTHQPKPWQTVFRCVDITYQFKDPIPNPKQNTFMRKWVNLLLGFNEDDKYGDAEWTGNVNFKVHRYSKKFRTRSQVIGLGMFHNEGKYLNIIEWFGPPANEFDFTREKVWKELKPYYDQLERDKERKLREAKQEVVRAQQELEMLKMGDPSEIGQDFKESGL